MTETPEIQFEDFFSEVSANNKEFVANINETLSKDGYKTKIESKASGLFMSYSHPRTKKVFFNVFFRKNGLFARIYADNFGKYPNFLDNLSENMVKEIGKSPTCKRLIDPTTCNQKCMMGYDFYVRGNNYKKCRMSCFQFSVNSESIPVLVEFVEKERKERQ